MAVHAPITAALTRAPFNILLPHRRELIEAEIELHLRRATTLIARLDRADDDCDLEDDDPAGDPLEERGEAPTDTGTDLLPVPPLYALDQSRGPANEREGYRAWQRQHHAN